MCTIEEEDEEQSELGDRIKRRGRERDEDEEME